MFSYLKFRFQRQSRRFRRDFRVIKNNLRHYFDLHIWGKWRQLGIIRRLVVIWWGLVAVSLIGFSNQFELYDRMASITRPIAGGVYTEALVGKVKILNPVFAENSASSDINRLIFSGLVKFNPKRALEPDLASSWSVSGDGKVYTFNLRKDVVWHDNRPFTSADVAFTIATIQNPDTRSPLAGSWQGIKVETPDQNTVVFTLSASYPPFLASTVVGIVPKHLLESVQPTSLRAADFNQKPVGTGPFKLKNFAGASGQVELEAHQKYFGGRPKLDRFAFRLFDTPQQCLDAYAKHQVNAVGRVVSKDHDQASKLAKIKLVELSLPDQSGLFLRTTSSILTDVAVRKALATGTDRDQIIDGVLFGRAISVRSPLLPGQVGYTAARMQPGYDLKAAKTLLDGAGWKEDSGKRVKDGKQLKLRLATLSGSDYQRVAEAVKVQWSLLGVEVELISEDSTTLQQTYIRPRNYDALLYGISIGNDPDVYSYWHSSQVNDPGLNLSQYNSATADKALEAGRINTDADIRAGKYQSFLAAWVEDTPAVMLYNPYYTYATSVDTGGIKAGKLVDPSDRFYNVHNWTIRTQTLLRQ